MINYYKPRRLDNAEFLRKTNGILDSCYFTNAGPNVAELERRIAAALGVEHCIAVCNATIGLQLVLKALDLSGEVITTPFSFVATSHAILWQGLTPVFCDIAPETLTLSTVEVEKLITPRTSAILGVHVFGSLCDVKRLQQIADAHHIRLIYDAAHCFMTRYKDTYVGNFGDAEVFSFHATKIFHTFEGGAIVTNNTELSKKIRLMKNFGFQGIDTVNYIGINAKMNELSAAYGVALLPYMNETIERLRYLQRQYRMRLNGVNGLRFFEKDSSIEANDQYLAVFIDKSQYGISRDKLWAYLWSNGIESRRYFHPGLHMCQPYRTTMPGLKDRLPNTGKITSEVLCLPCYFDLRDDQMELICELIRNAPQNIETIDDLFNDLITSDDVDNQMQNIAAVLRNEYNEK
ncbi:MAG: DegT/DnrJ/EryC1/StrS family aminotransferase [Candidatus Magnetominusculus sp. LBB02]|nr:DegT/DnrJ/EryC1/StrS family aminotransferase [Candidatus Magnetominusculus sp. LBB02]